MMTPKYPERVMDNNVGAWTGHGEVPPVTVCAWKGNGSVPPMTVTLWVSTTHACDEYTIL